MKRLALALASASVVWAGAAQAETIRMFSYDPADAETRAAAGPMTFEFRQGLLKATMLTARSTEADATVDLTPAPESALGGAKLTALAGAVAADRQLYAVWAGDEGAALIAALCPGSTRGWMAISHPHYGQDLGVDVLGDAPSGGARLCRKLAFTFHGEWRVPSSGKYDPRIAVRPKGPGG